MRIRIHNPIYGVPITFLDKWRPFEPVYILNPDRYANEYIISPNIKPFISVSCLTTTQFRIVGSADGSSWANQKETLKSLNFNPNMNPGGGLGIPMLNGKAVYKRLLIQKI